MKNIESWRAGKYVYKNGELVGSRDCAELSVGSRLITDLVASLYHTEIRKHARGRLLDLGCGKVPLYLVYKDYVTEIICVDWAGTLHSNAHLDYECDLTKSLPFLRGEFDTIILSDVLEHIPTPENLMGEIARLLAPGGKIIMNVPFYYPLHEQPHDYYRYTEYGLRRFFDILKMPVLELHIVGGAPEIIADILAKNVVRLPIVGQAAAALLQWACAWLVRGRLGRRLSAGTSARFPLGYFVVAQSA